MNISFWHKFFLYLKDLLVHVVSTVDFDSRHDEIDAGCFVSRDCFRHNYKTMTSRRRISYTVKGVDEVGKFSGIACGVISRLVVEILCRKTAL